MFLVDTNVLVDAVNIDSDFHDRCRLCLDRARQSASPWYLSWPICYDFMRVCTHPRVLSHSWNIAAAWNFLRTLLESPSASVLLPTMRHDDIFEEIIAETPHLRGNVLHDLHTAVLMREHGVREIYTRATDFTRFKFLRVRDPLEE
jgi:toxin-antitoxin system PIN domain toxin